MARTTQAMRVSLDIELRNPMDAQAMIDFADVIEDVVRGLASTKRVEWTQTIAMEPDFDYSQWNRIMKERRVANA